MKNWRTTLGGGLVALGSMLQATKYTLIGNALVAIGGAILGYSAKDKGVTNAPHPVEAHKVDK